MFFNTLGRSKVLDCSMADAAPFCSCQAVFARSSVSACCSVAWLVGSFTCDPLTASLVVRFMVLVELFRQFHVSP